MDTESTVIKIIPGGSREEKGQDEGELVNVNFGNIFVMNLQHLVTSNLAYKYLQAKSSTKPELKMASVQFLAGKICLNCHAHKTPLWRSGPYGTKTLCNACGVRHRYGRLPIYPLETVVLKAYEAFISPQWRQRTRESLAEEAAKQLQQSGEINPTKSSQPKKVLTEVRQCACESRP